MEDWVLSDHPLPKDHEHVTDTLVPKDYHLSNLSALLL
jgi:hypothetical protein